ncbi:TonB-dependent receptor plug domain-containing protein [Frateuria terrea]|uniref:TonB-dependent Receptor Plug Domain n=1 Tax=Frateuria terrea TaxID=529704 RepID=A0A1H6RI32_9GAMM|nr:TonB-dependent receptor [Frateuria terrea]SEI52177.1 TonB-dependent Receptor Plug Domain [Frateuria terrea]SFP16936.1 TonB-dependent Receptor Plug Domain [Frateuria terrea]
MHHVIRFRRKALTGALALALFLPLGALAQDAASTAPAPADSGKAQKKPVTLQKVVVTGSLIPRVEVEGPAPVVTITGEQLKREGFTTVYEVMNSITQTGVAQTPPSWGSSSVNARQLNLRNLGSGRSLLLIDGHRVSDYPQSSGASTNFQNYNNIPTGMIDHIEILATGASSLYGSDAVAGVVNIILKKHYEGDDVQFSLGGATHGGREYGDLNLVGGRSGDRWHVVYNLEKSHRDALWGRDRPYTDSEADAGYGAYDYNARLFGWNTYPGLALTNADGNYIAPPANSCGQFGNNFALRHSQTVSTTGHTVNTNDVTDHGYYCTQPDLFANWVLTPGSDNTDAYVAGDYDLGGGLQLYGSAGLWKTVGTSNTELPFLYPMGGLPNGFYDRTSGQVISNYFRQLTPQELGSYGNTHDREQNWDLRAGLRGSFMDDRFNWDFMLGQNKYIVHEYYAGLNEQGMFDFFFGPQQGTTTVNGETLPVYALNSQRFWNPITPAQYQSFGVSGENTAVSELDQATLNVNTDELFNLWAGPVGFGAVLEAVHQSFQLSPDPRGNDTHFGDPFQDYITGGGTRNRISLGSELRMPLTSQVTWTMSGRLDKYRDASAADVARTWGSSLEWRPYEGLLLRGGYGTNFHAPDMQYIYKNPSVSQVGIYSDYYQCIQAGDRTCNATQHSTYFQSYLAGGPTLNNETGHSWTYGFVWQIPGVQGLSVSADYWHIGIDNGIVNISQDDVLKDEAGCRTGLNVDGSPYIAHAQGSSYCRSVIANVKRDANGNITAVYSGPINESQLYVSGIDASLVYTKPTEHWGNFSLSIDYTDNLSYKERRLQSDPLENTRYDRVASRVRGTASWQGDRWSVTVYGERAGSIRANNFNGCEVLDNGIKPDLGDPDCVVYKGRIKPWIVWSGSVGYRFSDKANLRFGVTNIFDNKGEIPYYAGGFEFIPTLQGANYNGREVLATINYKLD